MKDASAIIKLFMPLGIEMLMKMKDTSAIVICFVYIWAEMFYRRLRYNHTFCTPPGLELLIKMKGA